MILQISQFPPFCSLSDLLQRIIPVLCQKESQEPIKIRSGRNWSSVLHSIHGSQIKGRAENDDRILSWTGSAMTVIMSLSILCEQIILEIHYQLCVIICAVHHERGCFMSSKKNVNEFCLINLISE